MFVPVHCYHSLVQENIHKQFRKRRTTNLCLEPRKKIKFIDFTNDKFIIDTFFILEEKKPKTKTIILVHG